MTKSRPLQLGRIFNINKNSLLILEIIAKSESSLSVSDIKMADDAPMIRSRCIRGNVNRYVESGLLRQTTEGARNRRFQINWDNEIASWIFHEFQGTKKQQWRRAYMKKYMKKYIPKHERGCFAQDGTWYS